MALLARLKCAAGCLGGDCGGRDHLVELARNSIVGATESDFVVWDVHRDWFFYRSRLAIFVSRTRLGWHFLHATVLRSCDMEWRIMSWEATSLAAHFHNGFDGVTTLTEDAENPKRNILLATVTFACLALVGGLKFIWRSGCGRSGRHSSRWRRRLWMFLGELASVLAETPAAWW